MESYKGTFDWPKPLPADRLKMLPVFREVLIDDDLAYYAMLREKGYLTEVDEYRWITSLKKIDWDKYFDKQTEIHELVELAADSIPNNPIGFLCPKYVDVAWVDRNLQKYESCCPKWAIEYAQAFLRAVKKKDYAEMKSWYETIKNRV